MKILAALSLLTLLASCTTLANRRDLYSPQPSPEYTRPARATTTTTTTTTQTEEPAPAVR